MIETPLEFQSDGTTCRGVLYTPDAGSKGFAYSGEREHSFRLNVNTFSLNALPTEVCTPGVHVQSIS